MARAGDILVGVAGWSYDDWRDIVYPATEKDKLAWMTRFLDCIEINTSFYRPIRARVAEKWLRDVSGNERFTFTAKLWSEFTHNTKDPYPEGEVATVKEGFAPLMDAGRLTAILIQFPFFFRDTAQNRDRLRRIAEDFAEFPRVLEVRDSSWAQPEALDFIEKRGLNVACLDMPWASTSFKADAVVTGQIGYLRLHGRNYDAWFRKATPSPSAGERGGSAQSASRESGAPAPARTASAGRDEKYDYLYSEQEMDGIVRRIERLREAARRVVAIWNNHFRGKAMVNALQSIHRLLGEKVNVPEPLLKAYPDLKGIARPPKGQLFSH